MASRMRSRRSSARGAAGLPGGSPRRNFGSRCEAAAAAAFAGRSSLGQDQVDCSSDRYVDVQKFQDFGPPSAPPIARDGEVDGIFNEIGESNDPFFLLQT
ncbi:hypothetical protein ZWY2020_038333 [Hordeum vulgare]|nr:hypothetical protein ZWY2020_038333 [Hordeum vulgare]